MLAFTPLFAEVPSYAMWSKAELEKNGFQEYSHTKNLELYLNKEEAIFAVRKVDSGYVWYSTIII